MTDRQKKLDSITDDLYYCMVELTSQANDLEGLGLNKDGDDIRSVVGTLEQIGIRLLNRMRSTRSA